MSQHNIVGSEAFQRAPYVLIRGVRPSGRRRQRARRLLVGVVALAISTAVGGAAAALMLAGVI
ncbi:hypothetical protein [Brevundimonas balnearis]|uniref:Uncharacterized protein n=1 Tax=Brevundimonas balnearis TaxID=1572858 RepID=A0ABV6R1T2_9CAUL